ncbi:COP23 domain-containing protein [Synechococcus sp. UW179A]|uniref:COP23 domain-containing protein n=1 Tax=Synechococcus sp. UW179A TaxID=2575510 RepID=UPI000E0FF417|nr:COP23 domain-containing protein [Synechococcus sp. UW179A]
MIDQGIPVTVVKTKTGKSVPIIYWKSTTFSGSGWTPERRCQEVSARFQQFHSSNSLDYITTGRMNGLPVICVANSDGGACAGLLYTLKPGQNATSTLKKLFNIQRKPGSAPLEETTARLYVNVDSIIQQKMGDALNPLPMSPAPTPSKPGYSLF